MVNTEPEHPSEIAVLPDKVVEIHGIHDLTQTDRAFQRNIFDVERVNGNHDRCHAEIAELRQPFPDDLLLLCPESIGFDVVNADMMSAECLNDGAECRETDKGFTAADVDEKAPDIVRDNAALNGVEDAFTVFVGDVIADSRLRKKLGGDYELVLANIVADVIIPLAPHVHEFMAPGGVFVCSGIIDGREGDVSAALEAAGLEILRHDHMDEWNAFVCKEGET